MFLYIPYLLSSLALLIAIALFKSKSNDEHMIFVIGIGLRIFEKKFEDLKNDNPHKYDLVVNLLEIISRQQCSAIRIRTFIKESGLKEDSGDKATLDSVEGELNDLAENNRKIYEYVNEPLFLSAVLYASYFIFEFFGFINKDFQDGFRNGFAYLIIYCIFKIYCLFNLSLDKDSKNGFKRFPRFYKHIVNRRIFFK